MSRSSAALLGVALVGSIGLSIAVAQQSAPKPTKLHEDIRVPEEQRAKTSALLGTGVAIVGAKPGAKQNPTAIASQDKLLSAPKAKNNAENGEPVHGRGGFGADRQTEARSDYFTGADNELHYREVFNPSIVPFKRMSALNAVREDYTLVMNSTARSDLSVGGEPIRGRDLFWGSVMVDLKTGFDVPIPSVAPGMRILSYESTPKASLIFSKDSADNYFVRTEEPGASGTFRVVFLTEASPSYFAPSPPRNIQVRDIPNSLIAPMPANVRAAAEQVLSDMRLHDKQSVDHVLNELIYYFRSFDAKSPPPNTGDIYLDLVKSQAGVCRHRSFAFMITANAIGIPTRYITNEAHAWVEVWLPGAGWMRVDLGGAAATLNVSNASDKTMYRPRGEDPFAKPESYEENYTRLEGDVKGLRADQIAERQAPYEGDSGAGEGNGSFFGQDENGDEIPTESDAFGDEGPLTGPDSDLPVEPDEEREGKLATYPTILGVEADGYRGETTLVSAGLFGEDGVGIEGMVLNIFLAPAGNGGNGSFRVGRGITGADGQANIEVELPTDHPLQAYEVFVGFNGNKTYRSAVSE